MAVFPTQVPDVGTWRLVLLQHQDGMMSLLPGFHFPLCYLPFAVFLAESGGLTEAPVK